MKSRVRTKILITVLNDISVLHIIVIVNLCFCFAEVPYAGLRTDQLKSLVQRARRGEHANWEGVISSYPLANCDDNDDRLFLQFNVNVNIGQKLQKLIGFGHPDLLHNLKYGPVHLFVDCTFSCVPKGFSQCLVIMAHDKSTSMYIPIFYVLMQSKLQMAYQHALRMCVAATDDNMEVINATCDFEKGIINALKCQFKKPIVGCEFHWKQAIRRKLLELNVPRDKITALVDANGLLNILTVIPIEDIENKGIPYIRQKFNEGQDKVKFDSFWKYFVATWMTQYNPEDWNIHRGRNSDLPADEVLNRTNNPLERFNKKLNGYFAARHPTMVQYVMGIRQISIDYVAELANIRRGHARPPVHQALTRHSIPADYEAFTSDMALAKSRYGQLSEYRFLENTNHYDPDDQMIYKITRVQWWERRKGEAYIVAHRIQSKYQRGYCIDVPDEDFISIKEAMEYTGLTMDAGGANANSARGVDSSTTTPKRKRSHEDVLTPVRDTNVNPSQSATPQRVHCECTKRNGDHCLAQLKRASPSAKRHPNAMYWGCNKRTVSISMIQLKYMD